MRCRFPSTQVFLGLAMASLLSIGNATAQGGPPPPISVAKPVVKEITEYDDYIGRFEAVDQVDVRARVSGYIEKIEFQDGAIVKQGDLLFTIDQRPYRAAFEEAEGTLESAKARLEYSTADLERAESLRKTNNISEQIFDQRRQSLNTARADVNRAEATLRRAKLDLEFTEIRAPISGRISRRLVSMGNLVTANETVLTNVVSIDPIHFYFDVDERSYLAYNKMAAAGTRPSSRTNPNEVWVATTDESEPRRLGHMDFVDNKIDAASGTIRGRAIFENKDMSLTPGLFGRVRIAGSGRYDGVLIPDEALATDQDRRIVYVVGTDNKVTPRAVKPGPRIDGYRVIREGLSGDDTIVVNGVVRVRPGMQIDPKVTVLPPQRERIGG